MLNRITLLTQINVMTMWVLSMENTYLKLINELCKPTEVTVSIAKDTSRQK